VLSQHESEIKNDLDQRLSFLLGVEKEKEFKKTEV